MSDMDVGGLSLDDVIKQKGIGRRGNNNRAGGAARQRRDGGIKKPSPKRNPKMWDNDKFFESTRGGSGNGGGRRAGGGSPRRISSGGKAIARLSNIPFTITQEDLDDLFADYRLPRISLHHDFRGKPLGTAELHGPQGVLSRLAREFKDVEIDGRPLVISIVAEGGGPIAGGGLGGSSRIRRVGGIGPRNGGGDRRSPRNAQRRSGGGAGGSKREPRKKLTAEDLDKELEEYMQGSKKD